MKPPSDLDVGLQDGTEDGEYLDLLERALADVLGIPVDRVSIKAKTGEQIESIGRGEALACEAVVLLARS